MVQVAGRASLLDERSDKSRLIDRANQMWDTQAAFEWRRKLLPPEEQECPVSYHTEAVDHCMDTHLLGSHVEKNIPEADSLQNVVFYSCEECGMVTDTNGMCHVCARLIQGNMERTLGLASNLSMYSPIARELPSRVSEQWTPNGYHSQGMVAADIFTPRCRSCGAAIIPGEDTCFSCIIRTSYLPDDMEPDFSSRCPDPVVEGMFPKVNSSNSTLLDENLTSFQSLSTTLYSDWGPDHVTNSVPPSLAEIDVFGRDNHFTRGTQPDLSHEYDSTSGFASRFDTMTNSSTLTIFSHSISSSSEPRIQPVYDKCQGSMTLTEQNSTRDKEHARPPSTKVSLKASICIRCRLEDQAVGPVPFVMNDTW